jgi:hypothetical protein
MVLLVLLNVMHGLLLDNLRSKPTGQQTLFDAIFHDALLGSILQNSAIGKKLSSNFFIKVCKNR